MKTKILSVLAEKEAENIHVNVDINKGANEMEALKILLGVIQEMFNKNQLDLHLWVMDGNEKTLFEEFKKLNSASSAPLR